jgi:hypothetical protein
LAWLKRCEARGPDTRLRLIQIIDDDDVMSGAPLAKPAAA